MSSANPDEGERTVFLFEVSLAQHIKITVSGEVDFAVLDTIEGWAARRRSWMVETAQRKQGP